MAGAGSVMNDEKTVVYSHHDTEHGSYRMYVTGFLLSVIFTLCAYLSVVHHVLAGNMLVFVLLVLAVVQFAVQMYYFLHIAHESKPRWKQLMVILMLTFVLIVVLGSIWIMYNLNYRMSPDKVMDYMRSQGGSF